MEGGQNGLFGVLVLSLVAKGFKLEKDHVTILFQAAMVLIAVKAMVRKIISQEIKEKNIRTVLFSK